MNISGVGAIPYTYSSPLCIFFDKVTEVAAGVFEGIKVFFSSHQLTFTVLRYGFYGIRIPFIYLEYFVHDMVRDTGIAIAANVLYLFSEVGSLAKWLHHLKLIDLGKVSLTLGKSTVLTALAACPIDASLNIFSGIASVFYTIDFTIKLVKGDLSRQEKIATWLGLTSCVIHIVAIAVFFGSGGSLFTVSLGLTAVSVLFYIVYWFLHRYPIKCLS